MQNSDETPVECEATVCEPSVGVKINLRRGPDVRSLTDVVMHYRAFSCSPFNELVKEREEFLSRPERFNVNRAIDVNVEEVTPRKEITHGEV